MGKSRLAEGHAFRSTAEQLKPAAQLTTPKANLTWLS